MDLTGLRALTVQQPWASAIIHLGKPIENRSQLWNHRGPLAIHASKTWDDAGGSSRVLTEAGSKVGGVFAPTSGEKYLPDFVFPGPEWPMGAFVGVVDLVDVHRCSDHDAETPCCDSPWAEYGYTWRGTKRTNLTHLKVANPRPLSEPIPWRGALNIWTPPAEVVELIGAAL